jgi:hypothetical protein
MADAAVLTTVSAVSTWNGGAGVAEDGPRYPEHAPRELASAGGAMARGPTLRACSWQWELTSKS